MEVVEGVQDDKELFEKEFENSASTKVTFERAIKHLRSKIPKDEWKAFSSPVETYEWTLLRVKRPELSEIVGHVLPPALLLADSYAPVYKVTGVRCILHCCENTDKVDLGRNNWGMVIYDALCKLVNDKETEVIEVLGTALVKILSFVEKDPNEACDKMTKYDDVMKQLLFAMEFCCDFNQKIVWIPHLVTLIETIGHGTLRWVDKIASMLMSFTISAKPAIWIGVLKVIEASIKTTWLNPSSLTFAEIILKIIYNQSIFVVEENENEENSDSIEIRQRSLFCFNLLSYCEDFDAVKEQLKEIQDKSLDNLENHKLHPKFLAELKKYNLEQFYSNS